MLFWTYSKQSRNVSYYYLLVEWDINFRVEPGFVFTKRFFIINNLVLQNWLFCLFFFSRIWKWLLQIFWPFTGKNYKARLYILIALKNAERITRLLICHFTQKICASFGSWIFRSLQSVKSICCIVSKYRQLLERKSSLMEGVYRITTEVFFLLLFLM